MEDRRIKILGLILFCVLSMQSGIGCRKSGEYSGPINGLKRYPYERAHLIYEYSGDVRGTEEFFLSDFGKYEARYSKIDVISAKEIQPSENGSITRLADQYAFDFAKKTTIHDHLTVLDSLYHLEGDAIPTSQEYFESEMKRNFFLNSGSDLIAGKPAIRWEQGNGALTIWMWNCILLRKHVNSKGTSLDMTIKSIDSLWTVDTTKFSVPQGFTVTETQH